MSDPIKQDNETTGAKIDWSKPVERYWQAQPEDADFIQPVTVHGSGLTRYVEVNGWRASAPDGSGRLIEALSGIPEESGWAVRNVPQPAPTPHQPLLPADAGVKCWNITRSGADSPRAGCEIEIDGHFAAISWASGFIGGPSGRIGGFPRTAANPNLHVEALAKFAAEWRAKRDAKPSESKSLQKLDNAADAEPVDRHADVLAFHRKFGCVIGDKPGVPS